MSSEREQGIVDELLGRDMSAVERMRTEGVVPSFLAAKYVREAAAVRASGVDEPSRTLEAALLRAALCDDEFDVRSASVTALMAQPFECRELVLLALALDPDWEIRECALEECLGVAEPELRSRLISLAIDLLHDDPEHDIRQRIRELATEIAD